MKPRTLAVVAVLAALLASLLVAPDAAAAAAADLSVTQVATPGASGTLKVTVSVTNNGPNAAGQVTLVEAIAGTGITAVSETSNNANTACVPTTVPAGFDRAKKCTVPQIVSTRTWKVAFTISAPTGTAIESRASAKGTTADPTLSNNTSVVSSWTGPVADIAVAVVSHTVSITGDTANLTVTNIGPDTAPDVVLKTTAGTFNTTAILCPDAQNPAKCVLTALSPGSKVHLTVQYVAPRIGNAGVVKIVSEVGFFDPNAANNKAVLPGN